jgi:hypothetical protein
MTGLDAASEATGEDGLVLVDPGSDGSDLIQLADDVDRLGVPESPGSPPTPTWGPPGLAFPVRQG